MGFQNEPQDFFFMNTPVVIPGEILKKIPEIYKYFCRNFIKSNIGETVSEIHPVVSSENPIHISWESFPEIA